MKKYIFLIPIFLASIAFAVDTVTIVPNGTVANGVKIQDQLIQVSSVSVNNFISSGTSNFCTSGTIGVTIGSSAVATQMLSNYGSIETILPGIDGTFSISDSTEQVEVFFNSSGTSYVTGGWVGIGTMTPVSLLTVASSITLTGNYETYLVLSTASAAPATKPGFAQFYSSASVAGVAEMKVVDGAGNHTLLSPHDPSTNEWVFDSYNSITDRSLYIYMERLAKAVEKLTGEKFVYENKPLSRY